MILKGNDVGSVVLADALLFGEDGTIRPYVSKSRGCFSSWMLEVIQSGNWQTEVSLDSVTK